MSLTRRTPTLARLAGLTLLLTLAGGSVQAASVDYFLEIDTIEGESTSSQAAGFEIQLFGNEPQAGLLVPAIQKVREARIDLARLACDGAVLPRVVMTASRPGEREPFLRYEMEDVLITSYSMRGGTGATEGESAPMEEVSFNYAKIEFTNLETGATLAVDCSSGRCACAP